MTPDGPVCNVQFVNATSQSVVIGTPVAGQTGFNAYQMAQWFNFGGPPPSPLAPPGGRASYFAQALRGGGDEDDAANLPVSLGDPNDATANLFAYNAGSNPDSSHDMIVVPGPGSAIETKSLILGLAPSAFFEATAPSQIQWSPITGPEFRVGFPTALSVIVADLSVLYDADAAAAINAAVTAKTLDQDQYVDLYAQVTGYCYPEFTTLSFNLTNVDFAAPSTPPTAGKTSIGSATYHIPPDASATQTVQFSTSTSQTFTMSSSTDWGGQASVEFNFPLKFLPGASLTGTFNHETADAKETQTSTTMDYQTEVTLPSGDWTVTGYVILSEKYTTTITGTLEVTGTITVPSVDTTAQPLNGTVLTSIMSNPDRNEGSQAGPFSAGSNATTAPVNGTISGTFATNGSVDVEPAMQPS